MMDLTIYYMIRNILDEQYESEGLDLYAYKELCYTLLACLDEYEEEGGDDPDEGEPIPEPVEEVDEKPKLRAVGG